MGCRRSSASSRTRPRTRGSAPRPRGRGGAPVVGETALKAFSLKDASFKASYAFPGGGLCNDIAVAKDGTVYATDTSGARVFGSGKGATAFDVWASDASLLGAADGIALLGDGSVYVNSVGQGTLLRIPIKSDGSAGTIVKLETSRPLTSPDGMRSVGNMTLLLVEGAGRLDEVTINGDRAEGEGAPRGPDRSDRRDPRRRHRLRVGSTTELTQ